MATQFFLRNRKSEVEWPAGTGYSALLTRGASAVSKVTNSAAGPTAGVQCTETAGGTAIEWWTPPLDAVTISGTINPNLRALESNVAANAGLQLTIDRCDAYGTVVDNVCNSEFGTELPTTQGANGTWNITPTSRTLTKFQRLRIRVLYNDAGGTMAAGQTMTLFLDGPTAAASGDSYITFTEDITVPLYNFAYDDFDTAIADSWGTLDTGGPWNNTGTQANYDKTGGYGLHTQTAPSVSMHSVVASVYVQDQKSLVRVKSNKLAVGASQFVYIGHRWVDHDNYYRYNVEFNTTAQVKLAIAKLVAQVSTDLFTPTVIGGQTHAADREFWLRAESTGINPTSLRAKVWQVGTAEPSAWQADITDATATVLQVPGGDSLRTFLGGATSNTPVVFSWKDWEINTPPARRNATYPQIIPQ